MTLDTSHAPGVTAVSGLVAELKAADELITELVTENEELRSTMARSRPAAGRPG